MLIIIKRVQEKKKRFRESSENLLFLHDKKCPKFFGKMSTIRSR